VKPRPYAGSLILMIAIVAVIGYDSLQDDAKTAGPRGGASGTARVQRAVDGDTVILSAGLGSSRIVGVDTPETVKPNTPVQCFGPKASAFTKRVLGKGREVRYRVALEPVDSYGRTLVYIWLPDGRFFNAMLIRRGYARPLPFPPNTRYASLFQRLAVNAARTGRGLWSHCDDP
jgi:micrococcal nuclease